MFDALHWATRLSRQRQHRDNFYQAFIFFAASRQTFLVVKASHVMFCLRHLQ